MTRLRFAVTNVRSQLTNNLPSVAEVNQRSEWRSDKKESQAKITAERETTTLIKSTRKMHNITVLLFVEIVIQLFNCGADSVCRAAFKCFCVKLYTNLEIVRHKGEKKQHK